MDDETIAVQTVHDQAEARAKRHAFGLRAHEIEGNPLDAEQIALFERFDRDGLSDEERRAVLLRRAQQRAAG